MQRDVGRVPGPTTGMSFTEVVAREDPAGSWSNGALGGRGVSTRDADAESVLCFGAFDSSNAPVGPAATSVTVVEPAACMWVQLTRQFGVVFIDVRTVEMTTPEKCRAVVHAAVQHLAPGGRLVASFERQDPNLAPYEQVCAEFDLEPGGREIAVGVCVVHRRTTHTTIHDLLFDARSRINRIESADLCAALDGRHPPTIIDTRTSTDRERFGVIRGSIHIPRTILEWACDPYNGYRHPAIRSHDQSLVIVCNGGYSSSLAASNLALLGFSAVCDLLGGHQAWVRSGHEVVAPDHTSLDY